MMSLRTLSALALAASLAVTLAACGGGATPPEPGPTDITAPSPTATETEEPDADAPTPLPSSCDELGTPATRAATVDLLNLQGDGSGFVRPAPPSAELVLGCDWFAGDATGILFLISRITDGEGPAFAEAALPGSGWDCLVGDTGNFICSIVTPNSQFPVDTTQVVVTRDDVWIYTSYTNIDGNLLLSDVTVSLWGMP